MERYAPTAKDLASRDVVSRSMTIEIREGRLVFFMNNLPSHKIPKSFYWSITTDGGKRLSNQQKENVCSRRHWREVGRE